MPAPIVPLLCRGLVKALRGLLVAIGLVPGAWAAAPPTLAADLHERVERLTLSARDRAGVRRSAEIEVTLYKPAGAGPFPLAVFNHGRGSADERRNRKRVRYEPLARYFVNKGFAVAVPTRIGYGASFGDFDPEAVGTCRDPRYDVLADATADQVLGVVDQLRDRSWIDSSRWLVVGQSVGGVAALAVAARQPAGLAAAISFAGGAGGNPERNPGMPCAPERLAAMWAARAAQASVPTLWIYWRNDRYWGDQVPRLWAAAWTRAGGRADLVQLAPLDGRDGHGGLSADMDHWVPQVEPWLARLGLGAPHPRVPTAPSGHAAVDELDRVPLPPTTVDNEYRRFLAAQPPRAFAVGPGGAWGWARGDWAAGQALGYCQRTRGQPCELYAVDETVVWPTRTDSSKRH